MRADTATEIIKEYFDIGESKFYFSHEGMSLSMDLDRTIRIDKYLCRTPKSLIDCFRRISGYTPTKPIPIVGENKCAMSNKFSSKLTEDPKEMIVSLLKEYFPDRSIDISRDDLTHELIAILRKRNHVIRINFSRQDFDYSHGDYAIRQHLTQRIIEAKQTHDIVVTQS